MKKFEVKSSVSSVVGAFPPDRASGPLATEVGESAIGVSSAASASLRLEGFDLRALRLPQNFGESLGVKRHITRVPVRKPLKTEFFRVRADEEFRFQTMILELKEEGETYLLAPELWGVVPELLRPAVLHTAIDRRNNVFLIPIPLPDPDGHRNPWHQSLAEVVSMAESKWLRSVANKHVSGYDMLVTEGDLPEPDWPELDFHKLVEIAFREKLIQSFDHPVINQLLGRS